MATESPFVALALETATRTLSAPLCIERGESLLYEIRVSPTLEVMDAAQIKKPRRGSSAFQTDLCVFERINEDTKIPRVVIEFKTRITTHDVLTYSAKALRHKRIYPYLRYGLLASGEKNIPGRAFTHNEALDFFFATDGLSSHDFESQFSALIQSEVESSRLLQEISYSKLNTRIFRMLPHVG